MELHDQIKQEKEFLKYDGDDKVVTFDDKREEIGNEIVPWTIKSGFPTLDVAVGGFRGGNLCVISAPTSQGKTTLCQTMTLNIVNSGDKVLWFPFEGDIVDFLDRLKGVKYEGFIPKKLQSNNMLWIKKRVAEAMVKFSPKVIFIDHLHYLIDLAYSSGNSSLSIGSVVRELVGIAKKYSIVIFLIAHIRKLTTVDREGNFRKPSLEDIRDSSLIAQECDQAILMWRKQAAGSTPEKPAWLNKATVSLQKNRRTGVLETFDVDLNETSRLFEEPTYKPSQRVENDNKDNSVTVFAPPGGWK